MKYKFVLYIVVWVFTYVIIIVIIIIKKEVQRLFYSYEINMNRIIYIIFMNKTYIKYLLNIIILNISIR